MDLNEVGRAAQTTINQRLIAAPVKINDNGNLYQVTGLRNFQFEVTALGPSGEPLQGGQTNLPCNETYLGLVFDSWISGGTGRTQAASTTGGPTGAGLGTGGGQQGQQAGGGARTQ